MKETIRIQAGGKEAEQFGGAAFCGAIGGKEPRAGYPTPATVEDLEGCFDSLAGVSMTGKRVSICLEYYGDYTTLFRSM